MELLKVNSPVWSLKIIIVWNLRFDTVVAEPLLITLEEVLELMKQISWEIRKRVLESPGFSVNFFCGNPVTYFPINLHLVYLIP